MKVLYDYGRHHPSTVLMPSRDIVMTYVVRTGWLGDKERVLDEDGYPLPADVGCTAHAVGGKSANQFGLHDMHGNVAEWCEDVVDLPRYGSRTDPRTICMSGFPIVVRGGSYVYPAEGCTSANYFLVGSLDGASLVGFRPVARLP